MLHGWFKSQSQSHRVVSRECWSFHVGCSALVVRMRTSTHAHMQQPSSFGVCFLIVFCHHLHPNTNLTIAPKSSTAAPVQLPYSGQCRSAPRSAALCRARKLIQHVFLLIGLLRCASQSANRSQESQARGNSSSTRGTCTTSQIHLLRYPRELHFHFLEKGSR